eukprot:gnl/MRDRNA2_/MRDRNA2_174224_c0_seq1.p1 gnl/MRDRNA2_/MRDRNA2_174224_c0~~gnl/MRDRNA2_/MRDRNA2_174224_c0_seq1.p1  ORF type:complete len:137 (+),score=19.39 gnl/MRDRNA2_/MRDRNA2_174224_c0_seq1:35-412(+)
MIAADEQATFQIIRNGDWNQRIYPSWSLAHFQVIRNGHLEQRICPAQNLPLCKDKMGPASGPDDRGHGLNWLIPPRTKEWRPRIILMEATQGALHVTYLDEKHGTSGDVLEQDAKHDASSDVLEQ